MYGPCMACINVSYLKNWDLYATSISLCFVQVRVYATSIACKVKYRLTLKEPLRMLFTMQLCIILEWLWLSLPSPRLILSRSPKHILFHSTHSMPTESKKRSRADTQQEDTTPKKKQQIASVGSDIDALLGAKSKRDPDQVENFRVITGTYERILYGINAYWEKTSVRNPSDPKAGDWLNFRVNLHWSLSLSFLPTRVAYALSLWAVHFWLREAQTRLSGYTTLRSAKNTGRLVATTRETSAISNSTENICCLQAKTKPFAYGGQRIGNTWRHSKDTSKFIFQNLVHNDWPECRGRVNSLAVHPSGKIALSVSSDRTVMVWNLMTARKASSNKLYKGMCVIRIELDDKMTHVLSRGFDCSLELGWFAVCHPFWPWD